MILVEATHWPLVVVGALPDSEDAQPPRMTTEEGCVWRGGDLRLAVVIAGDHSRAWIAQQEVFTWLRRNRGRIWRCVSRVAWIFEDELMRRNAERWLALVGDQLFRGDVTTFRSVRLAVSWLSTDVDGHESSQ